MFEAVLRNVVVVVVDFVAVALRLRWRVEEWKKFGFVFDEGVVVVVVVAMVMSVVVVVVQALDCSLFFDRRFHDA